MKLMGLLPLTKARHSKDIQEILNVLDGMAMNEGQITQLLYGLIKRVEAIENQNTNTVKKDRGDYRGVEFN